MTERPIIPGPTEDHNMAELCFLNGAECMKKRILQQLDEMADGSSGLVRATTLIIRDVIAEMDVRP